MAAGLTPIRRPGAWGVLMLPISWRARLMWKRMEPQVLLELQMDANDWVDLREAASELSGMM